MRLRSQSPKQHTITFSTTAQSSTAIMETSRRAAGALVSRLYVSQSVHQCKARSKQLPNKEIRVLLALLSRFVMKENGT
jgi:hypothetical protein